MIKEELQVQVEEKEYQIFNKFFGDEWKKAKKQIRKDLLNVNNLMPQKEEKAIQKSVESYRITKEQKEYLKSFR